MKKQLIILGSGNSTGVPRIDGFWGNCNKNNKKNIRTRCSAIIMKGENSVLIDTSPDIRYQLVNNNIKNISSVIYTHEHSDQTNGLFELRPFYWKNKKKINIYGTSKTVKNLKKRFDYCFKNSSYYPSIVKGNIIKSKFILGHSKEKILFKTVQVKHGLVKSLAYIFENTAYISDCNDLSIVNVKAFKNLKYLILDCLKMKDNWAHFSLAESLYVHFHLKPKKTILTNLHPDLDYDFLLQRLPNNVLPAYDGLKLKL
tara:strand:+ start:19152 stop:19922 length:771 start_codon:yes stop_codon:yes gene_type:complete